MKTLKFISVFLLLLSCLPLRSDDIDTVCLNMFYAFQGNPSSTAVGTVLDKMLPDGSFSDINYSTTTGEPRMHLNRLTILAQTYSYQWSSNHNDSLIREKFLAGLTFWINFDHRPSNWWYRYIAYPKELSRSVILMREVIKGDSVLFNKAVTYLRWSYEHAYSSIFTGANAADIIVGSMASSILTRNTEQMIEYRDQINKLISIQKDEGIEADFMFGQHCSHGRQLYTMAYGKEYLKSILNYLEFCGNTSYTSANTGVLENFFIQGIQWIFYSQHYDPNQAGRHNSSSLGASDIAKSCDRLINLSTAKKSDLETVRNRFHGENSLLGNRLFWRFDYMISRKDHYFASSRMTSTRTVGNEAGSGEGEYNYYSGSGVNYIMYTGKEYDGSYFSDFNPRQFPGITAEQDNRSLPVPEWGLNGGNNHAFAGGVSDGFYGSCAMALDRRGVTAHKSWFYFDDEFVCLGAGINQTTGTDPVYTTLNQCKKSTAIEYSAGGIVAIADTTEILTGPEWIRQGNIAYFNLDPDASIILSGTRGLFSANINHGVNPVDKKYGYIVRPGTVTATEADSYSGHLPVKIEANTKAIQAVRHLKLNITQAIFYSSGTLQLSNGVSISVDHPCALLWNASSGEISIGNPYCESNNPTAVGLTLSFGGVDRVFHFSLPSGNKAGSTVTQKSAQAINLIPVESLQLLEDSLYMLAGKSTTLHARVLPENATWQDLSWVSGNELIATVDNGGTLSARDTGITTIKVFTQEGDFVDSCKVRVGTEPTNLINLALDQRVSASGEESSETPARRVVDGNTSSENRWSASGFPQWIEIDLGEIKSIYRTELICYQDRAYQYLIEVSLTNDGNYTTLVNGIHNTTSGSVLNPITNFFPETKARFVRLTILGEGSGYAGSWVSITEFRVFGLNGQGSVSNDAQIKPDCQVYPNPFTSNFTIRFQQIQAYDRFTVTDIYGRIMQSGSFNGRLQEIHPPDSMDPGKMYFLILQGTDRSKVIKIFRSTP